MIDRPAGSLRGRGRHGSGRRCRPATRSVPRLLAALAILIWPAAGPSAAVINRELEAGARLVFPYYDIRPGTETFLLFTNVSDLPASVGLNFYGRDCIKTSSVLGLSPHDIDLVDVAAIAGSDPTGPSGQGFVDAETAQDALLGTAVIVNVAQDWMVVFPAAATQKLDGGATPFRPFPSKLFLPALLTPGTLGSDIIVDGLLILTAPHPTNPGGTLSEQPIQAGLVITDQDGRLANRHVVGHQVILPVAELTLGLPPLRIAWVELTNTAVDDSGQPIGLVGLFIQNLVRAGGGGMAMANRLWRVWCHPLFP